MDIKTYLKTFDMTEAELAQKAGTQRHTINRLKNGQRTCDDAVRAIVAATDGLISADDIIGTVLARPKVSQLNAVVADADRVRNG